MLPCPFCGGEPKYEVWSDSNYHKAECVDCAFEFDYCQTDEELEASWNKRASPAPCLHQIQEPAPVQADARDAELANVKQAYTELASMFHDQIVAQQAAWIEWQHGKGAEEGMGWIENGLCGPGHIPDEEATYGTEAQA